MLPWELVEKGSLNRNTRYINGYYNNVYMYVWVDFWTSCVCYVKHCMHQSCINKNDFSNVSISYFDLNGKSLHCTYRKIHLIHLINCFNIRTQSTVDRVFFWIFLNVSEKLSNHWFHGTTMHAQAMYLT